MDWFFKWLGNRIRRAQDEVKLSRADVTTRGGITSMQSMRRIEMVKAINGDLIEVFSRKSHQHDWEAEVYIVKDGESLVDAVATLLVVTGGK